ncbi:unnamed protein product [Bacillus thuringiensis DB27]|uniref:Uncharacterized protein n=1 Tax=Bacillus thuringiensis DB27 TaxID=1431339 RepID=W8YM68_BACTU|nr:unnamed protein product [Bacillus thuringiensis DB27]
MYLLFGVMWKKHGAFLSMVMVYGKIILPAIPTGFLGV